MMGRRSGRARPTMQLRNQGFLSYRTVMRYSLVFTVSCLLIAASAPLRGQSPAAGSTSVAAENARRRELEDKARSAALAVQNATDPKAREEAERQKRIAEIELEVLKAADRRSGSLVASSAQSSAP